MQNLIPDTYHGNGAVDWRQLCADPRFFGAIIKATEGVRYKWAETWFYENWSELKRVGTERDGIDWLRGCYHYLVFKDDPVKQAEYYLQTVENADTETIAFGKCDIMPIVDVELGAPGSINHSATAEQVVECTSAFVSYLKMHLACPVMLYGHQAMVQLGIKDKMQCDYLWMPTYGPKPASPESIGWNAQEVLLWQYTDGIHNTTKNPAVAPGLKSADISITQGIAATDPKVLSCRSNDY